MNRVYCEDGTCSVNNTDGSGVDNLAATECDDRAEKESIADVVKISYHENGI